MVFNANSGHKNCGAGIPCGGHAWSRDGLNWSAPFWPAFGTVTHYVDGRNETCDYAERPQVTQSDDGTPLTLFLARAAWVGGCYENIHTQAMMFCQAGDTDADCVTTIQ